MRPNEIDYTKKVEHYFDVEIHEVLAGKKEYNCHVAAGNDPASIKDLGQLLRLSSQELPYVEERIDTSQWSREDFLLCGRWIRKIVAPPNEGEKRLNIKVLRNACRLGMAPSRGAVRREFDTFGSFYTELRDPEAHIIGNFDSWTIDDFVAYIKDVGGEKRPTAERITQLGKRSRSKPQAPFIHNRFKHIGGYSALLELAGYTVVDLWERDDYISWGVKFMRANSGTMPTSRHANYFSMKKKGPAGRTIIDNFDKFSIFQMEVAKAYYASEQERQLAIDDQIESIRQGLEKSDIPHKLFTYGEDGSLMLDVSEEMNRSDFLNIVRDVLGDDEVVGRYSKFRVLGDVLAYLPAENRAKLAVVGEPNRTLASRVRKHHNVNPADLEYSAIMLGVFDFIWPPNANIENLVIEEEEFKQYCQERSKPVNRKRELSAK